MKNFLAQITWDDPYPKKYEYRIKASSMATGSARAIKKFRADNKGRKIKMIRLILSEL